MGNAMARPRDPVLDVFRGLAITLVVLGHVSGLPELLHKLIYSFHMPAFFAVSGYLFNARQAVDSPVLAVKRKFFRLLVPAWALGLACGLPFLLFLALQRRGVTPEVFLDKLAGTLTGAANVTHTFNCTPLWFLFCLFLVDTLAVATHAAFPRRGALLLLAVGAAGLAASHVGVGPLPFGLVPALTACLFFGAGLLLREFPRPWRALPAALPAIALLAWLALADLTPGIDMAANAMGRGPAIAANVAAAFAGSYLLLLVARAIARLDRPLTAFFGFLGANTLPVVGFNYWANSLAVETLGRALRPHWALLFAVELVLLLALCQALRHAGAPGRILSGTWVPAAKSVA
jgi:fucose 4-O-acetylase-like acetyltransferase